MNNLCSKQKWINVPILYHPQQQWNLPALLISDILCCIFVRLYIFFIYSLIIIFLRFSLRCFFMEPIHVFMVLFFYGFTFSWYIKTSLCFSDTNLLSATSIAGVFSNKLFIFQFCFWTCDKNNYFMCYVKKD